MGRDRALGDGEATPRTRLCDKVAFSHGGYKKRGTLAIIAEVAIIAVGARKWGRKEAGVRALGRLRTLGTLKTLYG